MRQLNVALFDHRVLERRINPFVSEELLQLLNGHSFVYCPCGKCSAELVRMHFFYIKPLANLTDS
jgi:hypothetical protein